MVQIYYIRTVNLACEDMPMLDECGIGQPVSITASFGVCSMEPANPTNPANLISCADKQMYIAKQTGRNKVVSALAPLSANS